MRIMGEFWTQVKKWLGDDDYGGDTPIGAGLGGPRPDDDEGGNVIDINSVHRKHEMLVAEPHSFEEALALIKEIKKGKTVLVNMHQMAASEHQRLVDLLTGAIVALNGNSRQVSKGIFTFVPSNVSLLAGPQGQQTWNQPPGNSAGQQVPPQYVHSAV